MGVNVAARHRAKRRSSPVPGVLAVLFVLICAGGVTFVLVNSTLRGGGTAAKVAGEARSTNGGREPLTVSGKVYDTVPDACAIVSSTLARRLAPGADKASTDETDSARESACTWAKFGQGQNRQLSVELRAMLGSDAAGQADRVFRAEWRADRTQRGAGAKSASLRDTLSGVGDAGYVTYGVDAGVGAAIVNVRVTNVLVTVHYSRNVGDDNKSARRAVVDGGLDVAKSVAERLANPPG